MCVCGGGEGAGGVQNGQVGKGLKGEGESEGGEGRKGGKRETCTLYITLCQDSVMYRSYHSCIEICQDSLMALL